MSIDPKNRFCVALLTASILQLSGPVLAQSSNGIAPPDRKILDENNVNILSGVWTHPGYDLSIGASDRSLSTNTNWQIQSSAWRDTYSSIYVSVLDRDDDLESQNDRVFSVSLGSDYETFLIEDLNNSPSGAQSYNRRGGILSRDYSPGHAFIYTDKEGVQYNFLASVMKDKYWERTTFEVSSITYPNGRRLEFSYSIIPFNAGLEILNYRRLNSVTDNLGLQIKYDYHKESGPPFQLARVRMLNMAYERCDVGPSSCVANSFSWPSISLSLDPPRGTNNFQSVTYGGGLVDIHEFNGVMHVGVAPAVGYGISVTQQRVDTWRDPCHGIYYAPCRFRVTSIRRSDGLEWNYSVANFGFLVNASSSQGETRLYESDLNALNRVTDEAGRSTSYSYVIYNPDGFDDRPAGRVFPEGNSVVYTYDERGNITRSEMAPKPGSGEVPVVLNAAYSLDCHNPVTCNKPLWIDDAKGNRTYFEWDPVHGGLLKETGPAVNGITPQRRLSYVQRYAWFKDASGAMARSSTPVWMLSQESSCRSGPPSGTGCANPGDEVVTLYDYGPDSGPNNLWLRGIVNDATGLSLRTCYTYDPYGHKISETTPRANLASCG